MTRNRSKAPPPTAPGSATSQAAGARVLPFRPTQRQRVYEELLAAGPEGLTRPELAKRTGFSENAVRPRVLELFDEGLAREAYGSASRDGCAIVVADRHVPDWWKAEEASQAEPIADEPQAELPLEPTPEPVAQEPAKPDRTPEGLAAGLELLRSLRDQLEP